jgi:putative FmdB family regulatory protein
MTPDRGRDFDAGSCAKASQPQMDNKTIVRIKQVIASNRMYYNMHTGRQRRTPLPLHFCALELRKRTSGSPTKMPIYEYVCDDCGTKFEKLVRRTEDARACPSCGESHLTTALSTFAAPSSSRSESAKSPAEFRTCGGGMCQTPGLCGGN